MRSTPVVRLSDGSGRSSTPAAKPALNAPVPRPAPTPVDKTLPPFSLSSSLLLLDTRDVAAFQAGHVLGAKSYPHLRVARDQVDALLYQYKASPRRVVVLVGDDALPNAPPQPHARGATGTAVPAAVTAGILRERGWEHVYVLTGGFDAFNAKYPHWVVRPAPSASAAPTPVAPAPAPRGHTPRTQELLHRAPNTSMYKATFVPPETHAPAPYGDKASANASQIRLTDNASYEDSNIGQQRRGHPQQHPQQQQQEQYYQQHQQQPPQHYGQQVNRFSETPAQQYYANDGYNQNASGNQGYNGGDYNHFDNNSQYSQDVDQQAQVESLQAQIAALQMSLAPQR
jgi:rhodanese-related sulfurtransferase